MWTNAGILLIGPLGTNFNEILIKIRTFSCKKIHLKMPSRIWRPCCLGLNLLRLTLKEDIKNNVWVTVNNDFLSRVRRFGNDFHEWRSHEWKSLPNRLTSCCQGPPFLTEHCDVTTIDLWRHANAKYWYCDFIFVYCHCTRKLAQRRSSLVNNSREYRYLATRYSRLSV